MDPMKIVLILLLILIGSLNYYWRGELSKTMNARIRVAKELIRVKGQLNEQMSVNNVLARECGL